MQDRLKNFKTLKDEDIDRARGFKEIVNSPVFRNFVISEDGKTSGIIVNIKKNHVTKDFNGKSIKLVTILKVRMEAPKLKAVCINVANVVLLN